MVKSTRSGTADAGKASPNATAQTLRKPPSLMAKPFRHLPGPDGPGFHPGSMQSKADRSSGFSRLGPQVRQDPGQARRITRAAGQPQNPLGRALRQAPHQSTAATWAHATAWAMKARDEGGVVKSLQGVILSVFPRD